jgi:hypothetical protein
VPQARPRPRHTGCRRATSGAASRGPGRSGRAAAAAA